MAKTISPNSLAEIMLVMFLLLAVVLLPGAAMRKESPGKLEMLIEVGGGPGAVGSIEQQKAIFGQLKATIESMLREHGPRLREETEEEKEGGSRGAQGHETKRIEVRAGEGLVRPPVPIGSPRTKKSALLRLRGQRSFLTESDAPKTDSAGGKVEVLEYTDDMLRIGTDRNLFLTVINNIDAMKLMEDKASIGPIEGLAIYRDPEDGKLVDFWHRLVFEEKGGAYKDQTGFFGGVLKGSWDELVRSTKLGKSGFFIDAGVTEESEQLMVYRLKRLVVDIAYFRKLRVSELMAKNKPLEMLESIVFYNLYPLRPGDVIDVCVCANNDCKKPCTEVQRVERKHFL